MSIIGGRKRDRRFVVILGLGYWIVWYIVVRLNLRLSGGVVFGCGIRFNFFRGE